MAMVYAIGSQVDNPAIKKEQQSLRGNFTGSTR